MGAKTYRLELDAERHPVLVLETEVPDFNTKITEPKRIVELCDSCTRLRFLAEENLVLVAVDVKKNVLGIFRVSQGTVNASFCNPREVFIRALVAGASGIFLLHNHPSGDCTPSSEDIMCAKKLSEAGKILGIEVIDFIIVGKDDYFSAQSEGII